MQVPVLETPDGCICEATAIARFIGRLRGDSNMFGASFFDAALVDQWIAFAKNEIDLPVGMWVYPILGFIESNAANTAQARAHPPSSENFKIGHVARAHPPSSNDRPRAWLLSRDLSKSGRASVRGV